MMSGDSADFEVRGYSLHRQFVFFFAGREAAEAKAQELRERGCAATIETLAPPINITEFGKAIDDAHD
jgi:hypothetical protein